MEPWTPRLFARPGRTSASGTTTATRQDFRTSGKYVKKIEAERFLKLKANDGRFYLQAVSVHKDLSHGATANVHVFNLLRCDVLALSELEDVLLTVDYL